MELPEQMARILQPHLVGSVSNDRAVLRDDKSGMTFQIAEMPKSARVIRIEKLQHLSGLADGRDLKRICDYLLVVASAGQDQVDAVFVEMKRTIGFDTLPREQLRRSGPLLEYLLSVCAVEFGRATEVRRRYVLVGEKLHKTFDKQPIRVTGAGASEEEYEGITIAILHGAGCRYQRMVN